MWARRYRKLYIRMGLSYFLMTGLAEEPMKPVIQWLIRNKLSFPHVIRLGQIKYLFNCFSPKLEVFLQSFKTFTGIIKRGTSLTFCWRWGMLIQFFFLALLILIVLAVNLNRKFYCNTIIQIPQYFNSSCR